MTSALAELQPTALWKHFDALAAIPRASTKEAAARTYVLAQASRLGLETAVDAAGNVVIRKPARPGRERATMAALQGHLDMVCEKDEETVHNFDTDGIRVVRDGDWLKADGTTLGADNGVGVASALAVMESTDIAHGPLELVFTIDEETGLTGAAEFPKAMLKSKYFLNLDGEEKGTLCIGCAGGLNTVARHKVTRRAAGPGTAWNVKVSGLTGGHSGVDIHKGRGHALRILGRVLQRALDRLPVEVAEIKGGNARNVIPREASAIVLLDNAREPELKSLLAGMESEIGAELGGFDPGLQISASKTERPGQVLDSSDLRRIVDFLICVPQGILAMSPDIPGLVQTSTNVGTLSTAGDEVQIEMLQRSAIESGKTAAGKTIQTVCRLTGFEYATTGGYPGWKPEPNSDIVRKLQAVHEKMFGAPAKLVAMHAGLECGVIGEKHPGMQMVSFGPQIENPHSPNERVQISSVETFWNYLKQVLEQL